MAFEGYTGYILAGGRSRRMGRDKALLETGAGSFLENAVQALRPVCAERVKAVLGADRPDLIKKISSSVPCVFDIYRNRGALGGMHAALTDCPTEFALILAVDLPFFTGEPIKELCRIAAAAENFDAFVPVQKDGRPQPLAAVYRTASCLPKADRLLKNKTRAAVRDLLANLAVRAIAQKALSDDERLLHNVNTPADLKSQWEKTD